jgi:hypothetical protein
VDRAQTAAEESESSANGNDVEHSADEASDDESGSEENSANGEHVAEDEENEGTNWPALTLVTILLLHILIIDLNNYALIMIFVILIYSSINDTFVLLQIFSSVHLISAPVSRCRLTCSKSENNCPITSC